MSGTKKGSAVNLGAENTMDWMEEILSRSNENAKACMKVAEQFHEDTRNVVVKGTEETCKTIAADGEETRKAIVASNKVTLDTIRAEAQTTRDLILEVNDIEPDARRRAWTIFASILVSAIVFVTVAMLANAQLSGEGGIFTVLIALATSVLAFVAMQLGGISGKIVGLFYKGKYNDDEDAEDDESEADTEDDGKFKWKGASKDVPKS